MNIFLPHFCAIMLSTKAISHPPLMRLRHFPSARRHVSSFFFPFLIISLPTKRAAVLPRTRLFSLRSVTASSSAYVCVSPAPAKGSVHSSRKHQSGVPCSHKGRRLFRCYALRLLRFTAKNPRPAVHSASSPPHSARLLSSPVGGRSVSLCVKVTTFSVSVRVSLMT